MVSRSGGGAASSGSGWRLSAENVKQDVYAKSVNHALAAYDQLIREGVCPEQAREQCSRKKCTQSGYGQDHYMDSIAFARYV